MFCFLICTFRPFLKWVWHNVQTSQTEEYGRKYVNVNVADVDNFVGAKYYIKQQQIIHWIQINYKKCFTIINHLTNYACFTICGEFHNGAHTKTNANPNPFSHPNALSYPNALSHPNPWVTLTHWVTLTLK